jgi:hypothetical protein
MKLYIQNAVLAAFALSAFAVAYSCKKDKAPKAKITITDSTGTAMEDATVIISCIQRPEEKRECNVTDTQKTDGVGAAEFDFVNPAVLRIYSWKENVVVKDTGTFPNIGQIRIGDTLCASDYITLEMNEVTEKTLVITRCKD